MAERSERFRIGFSADLLRPATGDASHRVTYIELFFDLVFVFAITQVSHILIHEQSGSSLVHTLILGWAVWWMWVYTTWASSWLNPETGAVRALFIVLMLFGLLVSIAIPEAFGARALLFAVSMVALQLSRSVFAIFAFARQSPAHAVNFVRISVWHAVAGAVWIIGAFVPDQARLWVWLLALVIDLVGPRVRYWTPGLGASRVETWNVSGEHMSERVSLFLIIALGESIVVTGSTFGAGTIGWATFGAFVGAFVGTVLMWLLYFTHNQRSGSEYIENAAGRGMVAQTAFTYIPILFVFGIVLAAVADGLVLQDPTGDTNVWTAGLLTGSAALYLVANAVFRRAVGGPWLGTHLVGAVVALALFVMHSVLTPLALSWLVNLVLLVVVVLDETANRRRAARATADAGP
ncbi:low temperature requirement protein A [Leifsonia sp. 2MCAF36]|uniref:low temperature requirement protein A n=1 Tax=Leifsonia sp. 2MCAF36 TaxID=3232988 RepID=UPI003F959FAC